MLLTEWLLYQIIFAGETNSCHSDILLPQQLRLLLNFIFVERSLPFNFSSKRLFLTSFVMPQRLAKCLVASIKSSCCDLFVHVVCVEGERGRRLQTLYDLGTHEWGKVFKDGPIKICRRQPLKSLK